MFQSLFRRRPRPAARPARPSLEELEVRNTPTTSAGTSLQALAGQTFNAVNVALSQAQQTQQAISSALQFTAQGSPLAPLFANVVTFDLQLQQVQAIQAQQLFNTFSSTFSGDLANGSLDSQDISAANAASASLSASTTQALQLAQTNTLTAGLLLDVNAPAVNVNNNFNAFPGFFSPFLFPGFFPGFLGSGFLGTGFLGGGLLGGGLLGGGLLGGGFGPGFGGPFFDPTSSFDFTDFGMPADFADFGGFNDFGGDFSDFGGDFGGGDFGGGDFGGGDFGGGDF